MSDKDSDRSSDRGGRDSDSQDRGGDLYDSGMGPLGSDGVRGGSVEFDKDGSGKDHHSVYGDDRHFSWDTDRDGNVSGVHGREHGSRDRSRDRDRW